MVAARDSVIQYSHDGQLAASYSRHCRQLVTDTLALTAADNDDDDDGELVRLGKDNDTLATGVQSAIATTEQSVMVSYKDGRVGTYTMAGN